MNLSLCMIVKDEAETLCRCLRSVTGVVDEIIVIDTGSQDQTPEMARDFGARVYFFEWCHDFAAARNQALQYVQGDWVLILDADEELVPEVIPLIRQTLHSQTHLLINLVRQEVGAAQSPYSLVSRLWRRHPDIYFTRPYHELVDESVAAILERESQWQIGYLPQVAIRHSGYQAGAIAKRQKLQRAREAMAAYLVEHPEDPYICSKLGALYVQTGEMQAGVELLQRGLQANPTATSVRYELHYHLALAHHRLGQNSQATGHYQAALQQQLPEILKLGACNNWGSLLQEQGNLPTAKAVFQHLLGVDPTFAVGHYNLGLTLKGLGDFTGAIAAYEQAIQLAPDYAEAHQNLGVVLLKVGQVAASLAAFRRAIALHEQTNPAEALRLQQGLQEMGFSL